MRLSKTIREYIISEVKNKAKPARDALKEQIKDGEKELDAKFEALAARANLIARDASERLAREAKDMFGISVRKSRLAHLRSKAPSEARLINFVNDRDTFEETFIDCRETADAFNAKSCRWISFHPGNKKLYPLEKKLADFDGKVMTTIGKIFLDLELGKDKRAIDEILAGVKF